MSKKVTSVNLNEEIAEHFANDPGKNLSGTVNMLLEEYLAGGGGEDAMLQLRQEQLRSEVSELESRLAAKREELETVSKRLNERREERQGDAEELARELLDQLTSFPDPENAAVENYAESAGMTPNEFYKVLNEVYRDA